MTGSLLTLDGVAVGYGRKAVLQDVNLELAVGSFTGLFGANGSGKSTLLKTILGIIPPLAGQIDLTPIAGRLPIFSYVPQRDTLDPIFLLSVFEVVLMGVCGRIAPGRKISRAEREFARECLRQTGVENLSRDRFSEVSGGQLQRVLIARALASRPDLLLLDEPIAGIDSSATEAVMQLLKRINEQQKVTILLVSHDLRAVRNFVSEIIWLHDGHAIQGSIGDLLSPEKVQQMLNIPLR